jgi:hypothetical protein
MLSVFTFTDTSARVPTPGLNSASTRGARDLTTLIWGSLRRLKTPEIWMRKLDWIAQHGGMALVDVHPDYLCFDNAIATSREYPVAHYNSFLEYVSRHYEGAFWNTTPRKVAQFCARIARDVPSQE